MSTATAEASLILTSEREWHGKPTIALSEVLDMAMSDEPTEEELALQAKYDIHSWNLA